MLTDDTSEPLDRDALLEELDGPEARRAKITELLKIPKEPQT
jgi:hypothetical protein